MGNTVISLESLAKCLQTTVQDLPAAFLVEWERMDLAVRAPEKTELEDYLFSLLQRLDAPQSRRSPEENLQIWEQGWRENFQALQEGVEPEIALKPAYFRDTPYLRFCSDLVVTDNLQLEYDLLTLVRIWLFENFLKDQSRVVELGCGTGQNLYLLGKMLPEKELVGLDWTRVSQQILSWLRDRQGLNIRGINYDLLQGGSWPDLGEGGAILTVHSFEQLGCAFAPVLEAILKSKVDLVVQLEPIVEFYDPENFYDYLALLYSKKRGYLRGYLEALRRLEGEGRLEILKAFRPGIGGVYHESSCLIWRPLC